MLLSLKTGKDILSQIFFLTGKQIENGECEEILRGLCDDSISMIAETVVSKEYYIFDRYNDIVSALGLEYLNGRDFGYKGERISGGEKNRVCLARTLLQDTTGIYLIDEPFTALDVFAEKECIAVLKKYISGKKGIIISHKMNVISELSEKIAVINGGLITELGTHSELMQKNELYADLVRNSIQ